MTIRRASSREVRGVQSMKAPVRTVQFRQCGSHMRMVACVGGTKTTAPAPAPRMAQCCPRRLPELTPCYEEVTVPIIKASTAVADIVRWVHGNRLPSSGNAEHVDGSRHVGGGFSQFICVLTHRSVQDRAEELLASERLGGCPHPLCCLADDRGWILRDQLAGMILSTYKVVYRIVHKLAMISYGQRA